MIALIKRYPVFSYYVLTFTISWVGVVLVLGDPSRLALLDLISHGERAVADLAAEAGLTESATSHQLRILRTARLVRVRRAGRQVFYALDDLHVARLLRDAAAHAGEK